MLEWSDKILTLREWSDEKNRASQGSSEYSCYSMRKWSNEGENTCLWFQWKQIWICVFTAVQNIFYCLRAIKFGIIYRKEMRITRAATPGQGPLIVSSVRKTCAKPPCKSIKQPLSLIYPNIKNHTFQDWKGRNAYLDCNPKEELFCYSIHYQHKHKLIVKWDKNFLRNRALHFNLFAKFNLITHSGLPARETCQQKSLTILHPRHLW